jgi:chorismate dehydratase
MSKTLRIGEISYTNLHPIFHVLKNEMQRPEYEFISGFPSQMNRMLREGRLDVSTSSSIEYLRNIDEYEYLPGHSISSRGDIGSILLFSRVPIESLAGQEVFATHQSETSVALLHIILCRFQDMDCRVRVTDAPFEEAVSSHSAYLAIGDEALIARHNSKKMDIDSAEPDASMCTIDHQLFYVYDLSALWYKYTGLPFVFALWIVRKDSMREKKQLVEQLNKDLDLARDSLSSQFADMADSAEFALPKDELLKYWRGIMYGLDEECLRGLELFRSYLIDLELL